MVEVVGVVWLVGVVGMKEKKIRSNWSQEMMMNVTHLLTMPHAAGKKTNQDIKRQSNLGKAFIPCISDTANKIQHFNNWLFLGIFLRLKYACF